MGTFLITGGAGFIGSHVVDSLLAQDHEVTVIDDLSTGSLASLAAGARFDGPRSCQSVSCEEIDPDSIAIHLAARPRCNLSVYAPVQDVLENYLPGMHFLLQCVKSNVRRVVLVSSMSVYGDAAAGPFVETLIPQPRDPYGVNKYALEQICRIEAQAHGVEYCIVRPQHVFGARQNPHMSYRNVIARWILRATHGRPLPVFGDLEVTRCFSPVSLVVRGIIAAATHPHGVGQVFNLGSGRSRSLSQIARMIQEAVPHPIRFEFRPAPPTLARESCGSVEKAFHLLGVRETPNEFEDNLAALVDSLTTADATDEIVPSAECMERQCALIYGQ